MHNYLPFLRWSRGYKKNDLHADLIAGLTVGVVLVPQAMAYAMVAGLPPVYGLYASIFPVLIYMVLGTSKHLAIGPVAMDSLLVGAVLGAMAIDGIENYIALAIVLAFCVGALQLLMGLLRMGFLVNFLSEPVIKGFTAAAALIIVASQLKHVLGVDLANASTLQGQLGEILARFHEVNVYDFGLGLFGLLLLLLLKWINKKIPAALVVVLVSIIVVYALKLEDHGVEVVGEIPQGLPSFLLPQITLVHLFEIGPMALVLAAVGYLEAISIAKALDDDEGHSTINANQELVALGTANLIGSFFRSYPVTASFSRSAINAQTRVKSKFAAFFAVALVVMTLLFLTPVFYYLPNAVLAAVIIVSVVGLLDYGYAKKLLQLSKSEFCIWSVTFFTTLFVGLPEGMLIGTLGSLFHLVYRTSMPHFAILGKIKGTDYYKNVARFGENVELRDDVLVVRFDSQLYFGNANYFKKSMQKAILDKGPSLKAVVLNAEAINYIDATAVNMLWGFIRSINERNLKFYIAGAIGPARDVIFSSRIIDILGKENMFIETKQAIAFFDDPHSLNEAGQLIAYQNHNLSN